MRIVSFGDFQIGVLEGEKVYDVSGVLPESLRGTPWAMPALIREFDNLRDELKGIMASTAPLELNDVRLQAPVPTPGQIIAAPRNYKAHQEEMDQTEMTYKDRARREGPREMGFFLKSPGSVCGPEDAIQLPDIPGRRFDHEAELALIIGKEAKGVKREKAFDHILGYTCLLDITMRMTEDKKEERDMRKSYETFTPIGPHIVTKEEIEDVSFLDISLRVNGDLRQYANTSQMIVGAAEFIELASSVVTLQPGDIIAMGTPEGIGPIEKGDVVSMEIEQIGRLSLPVQNREW